MCKVKQFLLQFGRYNTAGAAFIGRDGLDKRGKRGGQGVSYLQVELNKFDWYNQEYSSIDSNPLIRYLHLHCFLHMYKVLRGNAPSDYFSRPRFKLFKRIERLYHEKEEYHLFKNLIFTFLGNVIQGIVITLISASLNLMVPELIRQFMHFMREKHMEESQYSNFIYIFVLVQFLRIFFSEHSKRLFNELAIKVESTLARKLISKSLRMAKECRDRIPDSQLIQLENVDLKLIFNLFRNMNMIFEAPFTIIVSIFVLFNESSHYGIIGIYWFLVAFLLQRELDGRMTHCNTTKLKLIEQRSNLNYDLFDKFKAAKLIGWQNLLIQKNNDLFIEENHDHDMFYSYLTLYDITLLMLPIFVVATVTLFDVNEEDPITVEQVYLMLSLLGICYNPMKSFRTISINLHDGLHSLSRLSKYFHFPEYTRSGLLEKNQGQKGEIIIAEFTEAMHPHSSSDFNIVVDEEIIIDPGERLHLLGKKNSGCSSFLQMLLGNLKRVQGKIQISGKISFFPEKLFFLKDTVKENIRFFNRNISNMEIEEIYNEFGLNIDLRFENELNTMIDDESKFTKSVLKRICLARCLSSDADIYILDNPFEDLSDEYQQVVERRLRFLQDKSKTIILSSRHLFASSKNDYILILQDGHIAEYDKFEVLAGCVESKLSLFFKSNQDGKEFMEPLTGRIIQKFQRRVESAKSFEIKSAMPIFKKILNKQKIAHMNTAVTNKQIIEDIPQVEKFESLVLKFLTSVPFKESIFIFFIILAAEVLHIFIHFYIGHLEEEYGNEDYTKYKNMMIAELILTFVLAGLIYLEGQFSTIIATTIGNRIYSESLKDLTNKSLSWYSEQYNVKLADRYNHDYQQIYIACHSIFGIYKNLVILIATIEFISTNRSKLIAIFVVLAFIYYSIFYLFRKIERKIVKHYYDYKYNFVRSLEESIQGAELFSIYQIKNEVMTRAEAKYTELASYKLSASFTAYGLSLICDMFSISLLAIGIEYGIEMKLHHREQRISVIATSIFLLMNISQVLKTIIWQMLNFQTFFCINIIPFMEIKEIARSSITEDEVYDRTDSVIEFEGHRLDVNNIIIEEPGDNVKRDLLDFSVPEGEILLIYEKDHKSRDLVLYALTKNLPMFTDPAQFKTKNSTIRLGGISIKSIRRSRWLSKFGLLLEENFYFNGTIRENISWRFADYDHHEATKYAIALKLYKDFPFIEGDILDAKLIPEHRQSSSTLIKKVAFLRILIRKPKVVIIKDTDEYIQALYIIDILKKEIPGVTIIKISNSIEQCFDVDRIIYMDNMTIKEDGSPAKLKEDRYSKVGKQIQDMNMNSYTFQKKVSKKSRSPSPCK